MTSTIRCAIASIDKDQPIFAISTMNQLDSDSVSTRTFTLVLLGLFSGLALVLAAGLAAVTIRGARTSLADNG